MPMTPIEAARILRDLPRVETAKAARVAGLMDIVTGLLVVGFLALMHTISGFEGTTSLWMTTLSILGLCAYGLLAWHAVWSMGLAGGLVGPLLQTRGLVTIRLQVVLFLLTLVPIGLVFAGHSWGGPLLVWETVLVFLLGRAWVASRFPQGSHAKFVAAATVVVAGAAAVFTTSHEMGWSVCLLGLLANGVVLNQRS